MFELFYNINLITLFIYKRKDGSTGTINVNADIQKHIKEQLSSNKACTHEARILQKQRVDFKSGYRSTS